MKDKESAEKVLPVIATPINRGRNDTAFFSGLTKRQSGKLRRTKI